MVTKSTIFDAENVTRFGSRHIVHPVVLIWLNTILIIMWSAYQENIGWYFVHHVVPERKGIAEK